MARNLDPKCRQCRREGEKLFLKAEKCFTDKCAIEKRNFPPGQHGQRRNQRLSDYGVQLREKQKVRRIYGILEAQFRSYYAEADRRKGVTGENLLQILESRLDNVAFRMGLSPSRSGARQLVSHRHITVNGQLVNIPSYQLKAGDVVAVREKSKSLESIESSLANSSKVYEWITWNNDKKEGTYVSIPERIQIPENINEQYIVELYSK